MRSFQFALTFFLLMPFLNANAQSTEAEKYRKESEDMRKQVWAWDKPQFKVRDVPAQYANSSKVILAHHTELSADSKSKFRFYVVTFAVTKEQIVTEVVREMVKVNDKSAVKEYSEFSFTQFQRSSGFFIVDKKTAYVGIRVIKPDGSIKEINADDIVITKDGVAEKKAKVAVPDLQPGDIIDYFIATHQNMTNDFSDKPYQILLFDDAPILSLSFHAQLSKKYTITYRSFNGAPELQVGKNDDKDIIVDVEKTNIPAFETSFWVAPYKQLPIIKMSIAMGYRGMGSRFLGTRKPGEINKLTSGDAAIDERSESLSSSYYSNYWMRAARTQFTEIVADARKIMGDMDMSYKNMSAEDKVALLYYTFRFTKILNFGIDDLSKKIDIGKYDFDGMALILYCILKDADQDASMILSGQRDGLNLSEATDKNDINVTAYSKDLNKFLNIESVYDIPFVAPDKIEGVTETQELTFSNKATSVHKDLDKGPAIPVSTSEKNAHIENLKVSLSSDKKLLAVDRSTTLKGYYKKEEQQELILYEDLYESERLAFKKKMSLIEELEDSKKSKKYVEEVKNAFAAARSKQSDAFIKEAKEQFDQEVTNLKNYRTDSLGVRHTSPNFVYSSSFNLDGLVKKAGNNIIVEIGKIQGQPLSIKQEQRKRNIDVYMPFARSIEFNIQFDIPEGYAAEGVEALNKKVQNETGFFIVEAVTSGNTISIKIKKHYLHNFEKAENWDKVMAFIDAANDWMNSKILLKKK